MKRGGARRHTRGLQIAFLAVLAFSTAQVVWWVYDQARLAKQEGEWVAALYRTEAELARNLLAAGGDWETVSRRLPHLERVGGEVQPSPAALAALAAERRSRIRRYGWEGGFFLAVLLAAMAVIWRTLNEEAELRRRQENFLAAVGHEFKSPLASLQLSLDTIRMRRPGPERVAELVERMSADVSRLETFVGEVLDSAQLESGHRRLSKEPVGLAAVAREVAGELGRRAGADQVEIALAVPEELVLDADVVAVRTVLRNLLDNAVRAAGQNGGGRVALTAQAAGSEVRLAVTDDGVGFPPAEAANLFQKFYRLGDEMRRSSRGSGLGLYIVDRLLELEGGWVRAESPGPGRGATFTVAWPRHAGTRQP